MRACVCPARARTHSLRGWDGCSAPGERWQAKQRWYSASEQVKPVRVASCMRNRHIGESADALHTARPRDFARPSRALLALQSVRPAWKQRKRVASSSQTWCDAARDGASPRCPPLYVPPTVASNCNSGSQIVYCLRRQGQAVARRASYWALKQADGESGHAVLARRTACLYSRDFRPDARSDVHPRERTAMANSGWSAADARARDREHRPDRQMTGTARQVGNHCNDQACDLDHTVDERVVTTEVGWELEVREVELRFSRLFLSCPRRTPQNSPCRAAHGLN